MDVAVRPTGKRWVLPYDETGIEGLIPQIVDLGALVLLEATGGLELPLVAALAAAGGGGYPTPGQGLRQGHRYAGQDRRSGRGGPGPFRRRRPSSGSIWVEVRPLKDAETQVLNSLAARRHQVLTMLVSEKNRLGTAIGAVSPRIAAHIAWLEQALNDLDQGLLSFISYVRHCAEVQYGVRRMTCSARFPAWGNRFASLCWPTGRSWERWIDGRSPPWSAWLPTTATAAPGEANAPSGADAPGCGPSSTWERW